ncbi:MAG: transcriptional repressor [Vulcanimicrobiaceae bacterium]|jgi:Fur family ferric uptake transcriptional regulator
MNAQPRLPRNYELIREIVLSAGCGAHQTAGDIFQKARALRSAIGYATVHRGLTRLCELGTILKVEIPSGDAAWYEPPAPAHAHLLCTRCAALVDVDYATSQRTLRALSERQGVRIEAALVTFRGLCGACAAAARDGEPDTAETRA